MRQLLHRKALTGILLFLAALLVLIQAFSCGFFPLQADETCLAWAGKQAATGRTPYVDYFTFLPPATVFGLASFFKLFGATLGGLRALSILWIALATLLLYALSLRRGLTPLWAFAAAFSLPALYVPYWPVPSHHWFAAGLGLSAVLVTWQEHECPWRWFLGGLLTALSCFCLQTEGFFFLSFLLMYWVLLARSRWGIAAFAAGAAGPALFFGVLLAARGALGRAIYDLVTWPALYYKQPGGFNDVDPFQYIPHLFMSHLQGGGGPSGLAPAANLLLALGLPALVLLLPCFSPEWLRPAHRLPRRWILAAAATLLCCILYLRGRADWTHLVLWAPVLLLLLTEGVDWRSELWRPALVKAWLSFVLLSACIQWVPSVLADPPQPPEVLATDERYITEGLPAVLDRLPGVAEHKIPVLCLAKHGSALYFFWAPAPPPVDWLMPPSARYNAPWEYEELARFADERKVPFIVVPVDSYQAFLDEPSAISRLLGTRYHPFAETEWGRVLQRNSDEPGSP